MKERVRDRLARPVRDEAKGWSRVYRLGGVIEYARRHYSIRPVFSGIGRLHLQSRDWRVYYVEDWSKDSEGEFVSEWRTLAEAKEAAARDEGRRRPWLADR